jgi:hypothetical protein
VNDPSLARKRRRDRWGGAFLTLLAIGLALVVWIGPFRSQPPTDPLTLCLKDRPPKALLVVLVDTTDPISPIQKAQVDNELQNEIDKLVQYSEIQLYEVGPFGSELLKPIAAPVCDPGNPGSEDNGPKLNSNPRLDRKRWQSRFARPLNMKMKQLLSAPSAKTSPILESIQSVSVTVFGRPEFDEVPKKLVIVSDMVQNTAGFSQYDGVIPFERFRHEPYYITVRPHLKGVEVSILYLRRRNVIHIQGRAHIDFWKDYFADAGATFSSSAVTPIEG